MVSKLYCSFPNFIVTNHSAAVRTATIALFWLIPKGFFPQQDTGQIVDASEAPPDISAAAIAARQIALFDCAVGDPAVANVNS